MKKNIRNKKKGQGMTEYIIIVALIAVVCIGAVRIVGQNVDTNFRNIANALHGGGPAEIDTVQANEQVRRTMGNFYDGADFE